MLLVTILETTRLGCFDHLYSPGMAVPLVVGLCLALATHMSECNTRSDGMLHISGVFVALCTFGQSSHCKNCLESTKTFAFPSHWPSSDE